MCKKSSRIFRGFWLRVLAALLDMYVFFGTIMFLIFIIVGEIIGFDKYADFFVRSCYGNPFLIYIYWFIFPFGIFTLAFWLIFSATPGKMCIQARIVDVTTGQKPAWIKLIIRYAAYILSALPFGLGFIWTAFDSRKQGWHDKLANTVVINKKTVNETSFPTTARKNETKAFGIVFGSSCILMAVLITLSIRAVFFDDALPPEVKEWISEEKPICDANNNAYYYLMGLSSAENIDPYLAGKKRADNLSKAIKNRKHIEDELNFKEPGASELMQIGEEIENICDPAKADCIKVYAQTDYSKKIPATQYQTIIERYKGLYDHDCYQTTVKPDMVAPIPAYVNLGKFQCLNSSLIAKTYNDGGKATALTQLGKDIKYYRSMIEQSDTLIAKMVFLVCLKRDLHFYSQLMDIEKVLPEEVNKFGETITPLTRQEISLKKPMKYEIKGSAFMVTETLESALDKIRYEKNPDEEEDFYSEAMKKAFRKRFAKMTDQEFRQSMIPMYKENATIMTFYRSYMQAAKISEMDVDGFLSEMKKGQQDTVSYYDYLHNPIASILASIGSPYYADYSIKFFDCNGLIRLLQLKRLIKLNNIKPDKIGRYLKDESKEYGDPYTGQPMKWDAKRKVISFSPISKKSKQMDYEISIP